jgi:hypothetical protein
MRKQRPATTSGPLYYVQDPFSGHIVWAHCFCSTCNQPCMLPYPISQPTPLRYLHSLYNVAVQLLAVLRVLCFA